MTKLVNVGFMIIISISKFLITVLSLSMIFVELCDPLIKERLK